MKNTSGGSDPEKTEVIRVTGSRTRRETDVGAVSDFNRRLRMAELTKYAGTCHDLITPEELQAERRRG